MLSKLSTIIGRKKVNIVKVKKQINFNRYLLSLKLFLVLYRNLMSHGIKLVILMVSLKTDPIKKRSQKTLTCNSSKDYY